MTAAVWVCPLSRLPATLAATEAQHVVTLLASDQRGQVPPLPGLAHLALDLSDITTPRDGYTARRPRTTWRISWPSRDGWDRRRPLLIHCYAGVSRSTAAAFAVACALAPEEAEAGIASRLRAASPSATPNPRFVALADAALGREGRMSAAIAAIGRGRDCFEGDVFALTVPAPAAQIAGVPAVAVVLPIAAVPVAEVGELSTSSSRMTYFDIL